MTSRTTGQHNTHWEQSRTRFYRGATYKDCATICVIPTRGLIPAKVMQSWFNLFAPTNQKFERIVVEGMETGLAYQWAIDKILADPKWSTWSYVLTLEDDNLPPPDGLIRLIEAIEGGVDGHIYDAVGGLYWTKKPDGHPMIYGVPGELPLHFRPQVPQTDTVQPCCGLGMGFTLFRLQMFKALSRPWFRTVSAWNAEFGVQKYTQDLFFFERASQAGHRFACDTRVKVGHLDAETGKIW